MIVKELVGLLGLEVDEKGFKLADELFGDLNKTIATGIGTVLAAGAGLAALVLHNAHHARELEHVAEKTGLSTTAVQEYHKAAAAAGIETETFDHSLQLLARSAYAASEGGEEQAKAYHKLGVKLKDGKGHIRDTDSLVMDLAEAFHKLEPGLERTALAQKAFGRGGAELLPLLAMGRDAINEYRNSAFVLSEEQIHQAKTLDIAWTLLKGSIGSLSKELTAELTPAFTEIIEATRDWFKENRELIMQRLHQAVSLLTFALKALWLAFRIVVGAIQFVLKWWKVLVGAFVIGLGVTIAMNASLILMLAALAKMALVAQLALVSAAWSAAVAWAVAAAPIVAIVALIAFFIWAVLDLYVALTNPKARTFFGPIIQGIKNAIKDFQDNWRFDPANSPLGRGFLVLLGYLERMNVLMDKVGNSALGRLFGDSEEAPRADIDAGGMPMLSRPEPILDMGGAGVLRNSSSVSNEVNTFNIYQQPGESGGEFVKRFAREIDLQKAHEAVRK